jgi:hypothetical protein
MIEATTVYTLIIRRDKNCFEPENHGRVKHVDVRMHYIREQVKKGKIKLVYRSSGYRCRHSDNLEEQSSVDSEMRC